MYSTDKGNEEINEMYVLILPWKRMCNWGYIKKIPVSNKLTQWCLEQNGDNFTN